MGTDASVFALQVPRRAQPCDGSHGWKRALARIVEPSHPDSRKTGAPLFSFSTVSPDSETRIGAAGWAPGVDRATVHPPG